MKINELITEYLGISENEVSEVVSALRIEREGKPKLSELKEQWKVKGHRVKTDQDFLKDKVLKDVKGEVIGKKMVNRIAVPFQKMIVNRSVSFGFGNPVRIQYPKDLEGGKEFIELMEKILYLNKTKILDRQIARELYRSTEVAEIWYFRKLEKPHNDYGFPCSYDLRVKVFKPWENDTLYPMFDDYDNLIAFSRGYVSLKGKNKAEYLEVYTDEDLRRYKKMDSEWIDDSEALRKEMGLEEGMAITQIISKIPIVYAHQDESEWNDVQDDIERLELLFSRHAEINDYHAAPKTFVKGTLETMPESGESNGVLQGGPDTDVKVLSWAQSPDSIKLEIETRLENIHKFTQTPEISFNSVKGLNQISGVLLKMLFMDAHLKVMEKSEIWDVYFQRRYSIIKSFIITLIQPKFKPVSEKITMEPLFRPYMITDDKERVETLTTANGGKALISHEASVLEADLVVDPNTDFLTILREQKESLRIDLTESMNYGDPEDEENPEV